MTKIFNRRKFKIIRFKLKKESSPPEIKLWYAINNKQLGYKFRRQHGITNYIVDFYCPELKLIIEIDGESHTDKQILVSDKIRDTKLNSLGFIVKRYYTNEVLDNFDGVIYDIKQVCDNLSGEVRILWD